jgi:tetratricopeptide (TPR) repeat protein
VTGVDPGDGQFAAIRAALAPQYDVQGPIGHGGMAVVYRAHDTRHSRDVAVKVMRPEVATAVGTERFLREILLESKLQHPNILPLHDSGVVSGVPFYVMPLVEGASLRERLRREGPLPVEDAVRIAGEVADALRWAHSFGIVHRDIKPENILLAGEHAVVSDFGIARAVTEAGAERLTSSGIVIGTPVYMSPEQATGGAVDPRSDLYSLGCVLYEMLAGEPPFGGPTAQAIIARHAHEHPPSLTVVRPELPSGVVAVVEKALAKIPADRYRTAEAMRDALATALTDGRPRSNRRRLGVLGATAVAVLALAVLLGRPKPAPLDAHRLVVFPLLARGLPADQAGAGLDVGLALVEALDHAAPLRAEDGWRYLDAAGRADVATVSAARARAVTRGRGARFYIEGSVRAGPDSTFVSLALHDAAGDSLVARETAAGVGMPLYLVGLDALRRLLPALLDPGRTTDFGLLTQGNAAAISLWLQGGRAYRASRFGEALDLFERAVREDSALVLAAIRGAEAASWSEQPRRAHTLIRLAVAQRTRLSERHQAYALGLAAYLEGDTDSAVRSLERARRMAPGWVEVDAALSEVYYHLLPAGAGQDSIAEALLRAAIEADTTFTPALVHQIELAAQRGEAPRAVALLTAYRRLAPDTTILPYLDAAVTCVRGGPERMDWRAVARANARVAVQAGKVLSPGARQAACAGGAFRAVLAEPGAVVGFRWAALVGLQGLLVAAGRGAEAARLLDSAAAAGESQAYSYHVLGTIAGAPMGRGTGALEALVADAFGGDYRRLRAPQALWVLGVLYAARGDSARLRDVRNALREPRADRDPREVDLFSRALAAHRALLRGDTAGAIAELKALRSTAPRARLEWEHGEPLPVERLRLAELQLATGRYAEAMETAAGFDHPAPVVYLGFVGRSLEIRRDAARALGNARLQRLFEDRLARLRAPPGGSEP